MTSDADRFRPREQSAVAEQSPPAQPETPSPRTSASTPDASRAAGPPQNASSPYAASPYASPPYASVPYASPPYAGLRTGVPGQEHGFDDRNAPLIHPAAAQASNAVAYGVPVYRAPVYGIPVPQARGLSITALVLGICSAIFAWTLIVVPIIGIVFGAIALRREPAGRTMATVGLITSALGLLWVLLFYALPFGAFFAAMLLGGFLV